MFLSAAAYIILLAGGVRPLARKLNKSPASVSKWRYYTNKAGETGGIPRSVHRQLLQLAQDLNWDLTAQDLVNGKKLSKDHPIPKNFKP